MQANTSYTAYETGLDQSCFSTIFTFQFSSFQLSLGDVINPDRQIDFNRDQIAFKLTFSIQTLGIKINHRDEIDKNESGFNRNDQI